MRSHDFYHCLVENVISTRSVELVSKRFHISIIHISYHHLTTVKQNHKIAILIIRIVRPHRSTTYVDVAYCYRLSSVVCRSVCLSVTIVSPAKTAVPIELPFGLRV